MSLKSSSVRQLWLSKNTLALQVALGHLWLVEGKWVGAVGELGGTVGVVSKVQLKGGRKGRKKGREGRYEPGVVVCGCDLTLLVIVRSLEYWSRPIRKKTLGDTLDSDFRAFALSVVKHHLSNTRTHEGLLINWQVLQGLEQVTLNIIRWKRTIVQWLEEELDGLKEVGLWINDGVANGVAVQNTDDFWQHLELVDSWLPVFARGVVLLARGFHADL